MRAYNHHPPENKFHVLGSIRLSIQNEITSKVESGLFSVQCSTSKLDLSFVRSNIATADSVQRSTSKFDLSNVASAAVRGQFFDRDTGVRLK